MSKDAARKLRHKTMVDYVNLHRKELKVNDNIVLNGNDQDDLYDWELAILLGDSWWKTQIRNKTPGWEGLQ